RRPRPSGEPRSLLRALWRVAGIGGQEPFADGASGLAGGGGLPDGVSRGAGAARFPTDGAAQSADGVTSAGAEPGPQSVEVPGREPLRLSRLLRPAWAG